MFTLYIVTMFHFARKLLLKLTIFNRIVQHFTKIIFMRHSFIQKKVVVSAKESSRIS